MSASDPLTDNYELTVVRDHRRWHATVTFAARLAHDEFVAYVGRDRFTSHNRDRAVNDAVNAVAAHQAARINARLRGLERRRNEFTFGHRP